MQCGKEMAPEGFGGSFDIVQGQTLIDDDTYCLHRFGTSYLLLDRTTELFGCYLTLRKTEAGTSARVLSLSLYTLLIVGEILQYLFRVRKHRSGRGA